MADRATYRWTNLCTAAYCGRVDILRLFLGHKTFPNSFARQQLEILASGAGYTQCDTDEYSENGDTALIVASRRGYVDICRELIRHGASVNKPCQSTGETSLAIAIEQNHEDVVDCLLNAHCDVQTYDNVKSTPLYAAVRSQDPAYVEKLIRHGADPNIGSQDHTPIFLAARLGLLVIAKILENAGCCLDSVNVHGLTPLHEACLKGQVEMVEYFTSKGCDVNRVDDEWCSPLMSAAAAGHLQICHLLVSAGADVYARNREEENSLNVTLMNGHAEVAEFLLEQGLEVCSPGEYSHSVNKMIQGNHHEAAAVLLPWCSDLDLAGCLDWPYLGIHNLIWNDRRLLRMLFISGVKGGQAVLKMMTPMPSGTADLCPHEHFLQQRRNQPLSLKDLSRIVVRRCLGNRVISQMEHLPLPRCVKDFVALKEF